MTGAPVATGCETKLQIAPPAMGQLLRSAAYYNAKGCSFQQNCCGGNAPHVETRYSSHSAEGIARKGAPTNSERER